MQTTNTREPRLGVVIPLANEEATVEELLSRVCEQLEVNDRVFCVLDLASKDNTLDLVQQFADRENRVQPVWAPENQCVVDAYFSGYRAALAENCQWILEMDGGFSHNPDHIPRFIDAMVAGIDFAAGSRFCRGGRYIGIGWRRLVSWGGTLLANVLLGTRMKDMTSGFECFSNRALTHIVQQGVRSRGHFFQTEIRFMLHDWSWVEVPITYQNPSNRLGRSSLKDAFSNLWRLRRQRRRHDTCPNP